MEWTIAAHALEKHYRDLVVVRGVDFRIRPGECFGFLGPNGAGKTTIMRMIQCVSPPTAGRLSIFGMDALRHGKAVRARVGVCPQNDTLDAELSVQQNLEVYGSYFNRPRRWVRQRAAELLAVAELRDRNTAPVRELSGGMARRLTIARALINDPDLMLLDEPSTALDPQSRHKVWQQLRVLKDQGVTMVLTTHSMTEAEELCDRLMIIDRGVVIAEGVPSQLVERHAGDRTIEIRASPEQETMLRSRLDLAPFESERAGDQLILFVRNQRERGNRLVAGCHELGLSCRLRPASLEDVFLKLTGRELRD